MQGHNAEVECRVDDPDVSVRWVRCRIFPIRNAAEQVYRIVGVAEDVTARKRAQQEAAARREELAHAARVATISELASGLAHELNQPLYAILGCAELCQRLMADGQGETVECREAMEEIANQAERAGDIIRQMRTFMNRSGQKRALVPLNGIVHKAASLVEQEAKRRNVALRMKLAPDDPKPFVDAIHIEQVILNLMRNGIEAMSSCDCGPHQLIISTSTPNKHEVKVSVSDTGPGLPDENPERLFESFFTSKPSGLGIGLSLSRSIIESHGGLIRAGNNPDHGAFFEFTLPMESDGT